MTTSITSSPVSEGQKKQFRRFVLDAAERAAELALEQITLDGEGIQQVLGRGDEFQSAIVATIVAKTRALGSSKLTPERAREIMGRNFFGVEEATKHFGVKPTPAQLSVLSEIPWSEETLESCKDTHVLVAVFLLSILDVRAKAKSALFYDQSWYNKESFAKDKGTVVGWQLVRKTPVDNSTSKSWSEQQALLATNEETPAARVIVYTIISHFLATGERLFERIYVRCVDVDSSGNRVSVGRFGAVGLLVDARWGGDRGDSIGAASARKFD